MKIKAIGVDIGQTIIEYNKPLNWKSYIALKVGVLTDVAYGMDNVYSLNDIKSLSQYIDVALTSVDVGYRKPNEKGFKLLLEGLNVNPEEMIFIGDEEKDIIGAKNAGIYSVLINRDNVLKDYSQHYTISNLSKLIDII